MTIPAGEMVPEETQAGTSMEDGEVNGEAILKVAGKTLVGKVQVKVGLGAGDVKCWKMNMVDVAASTRSLMRQGCNLRVCSRVSSAFHLWLQYTTSHRAGAILALCKRQAPLRPAHQMRKMSLFAFQ